MNLYLLIAVICGAVIVAIGVTVIGVGTYRWWINRRENIAWLPLDDWDDTELNVFGIDDKGVPFTKEDANRARPLLDDIIRRAAADHEPSIFNELAAKHALPTDTIRFRKLGPERHVIELTPAWRCPLELDGAVGS